MIKEIHKRGKIYEKQEYPHPCLGKTAVTGSISPGPGYEMCKVPRYQQMPLSITHRLRFFISLRKIKTFIKAF